MSAFIINQRAIIRNDQRSQSNLNIILKIPQGTVIAWAILFTKTGIKQIKIITNKKKSITIIK